MKFHFCGENDCPDWVLAEIHSTLAVLSSIKLRALTQCVAKTISGEEIVDDKIKDIFTNSKIEPSGVKSAIACIRFLLISASKYNINEHIFDAELQQIGLPKEHSSAICRVLVEYILNIRKRLVQSQLTVNHLDKIKYDSFNNVRDCIKLQVEIKNEILNGSSICNKHEINVYKVDLQLLLNELKMINTIIENYN